MFDMFKGIGAGRIISALGLFLIMSVIATFLYREQQESADKQLKIEQSKVTK